VALLTWGALALCFVIGLAGVARMAGPVDAAGPVSSVIRLPLPVTASIGTLFALAAAVFVGHVLRRGWSRRRKGDGELDPAAEAARLPAWLRTVTQLASFAYFVALAYLLWRSGVQFPGLLSLGAGAGSGEGLAFPRLAPPDAPAFMTWAFGILGVAAGAAAVVAAVWVALADRAAAWRVAAEPDDGPASVEAAVEESLEDLRSELDARRAIVRCYARFERAAADSGVARQPWHTPMEFMREALGRLPVPRAAVPTLTGLFELARFSHHPLGPDERARALDALDEIRAAIAARSGDAAAR
jgi:hypothetical protein